MKIAICCIYYKAVTPAFYVIELEETEWRKFLYMSPREKKTFYIEKFNRQYLGGSIREIAWIPLTDLNVSILQRHI